MSRIRSIHPGIYSDEAWASVSIAARWLGVGLCTEADDNGVFDWKVLQIKMRLFPADNVNVAELLSELEAAGIVRAFEVDGRRLGAIRNFCKFQSPRKPKAWFPITDDVSRFVGGAVTQKSEPEPVEATPVTQKSVLTPVKEPSVPTGEERRGKETEPNGSDAPSASPAVLRTPHEAMTETVWRNCPPHLENLGLSGRNARSNLGKWLKEHPPDQVLRAVDAAVKAGTRDPIPYIAGVLAERAKEPLWKRRQQAEADDYMAIIEARVQ